MGLDVTAYRQIKKFDCPVDEDGKVIVTDDLLDREDIFFVGDNPHFPTHATDLEAGAFYGYTAKLGLAAGSYGGYNDWRDNLAKLAGWAARDHVRYGLTSTSHCVDCWNGTKGPFSELINFSDCDGTIGTEVSKKLAKDFADYQETANAIVGESFLRKYNEWRQAFELAADGGCVVFH